MERILLILLGFLVFGLIGWGSTQILRRQKLSEKPIIDISINPDYLRRVQLSLSLVFLLITLAACVFAIQSESLVNFIVGIIFAGLFGFQLQNIRYLSAVVNQESKANSTSQNNIDFAPPEETIVTKKYLVYVNSSLEDNVEADQLLSHLKVLQKNDLVDLWGNESIEAGTDRENEIHKKISEASVVILLITANFLNSDFSSEKIIRDILHRQKDEGLTVIPVIAKACAWTSISWLTKMRTNVMPQSGRPVWGNSDGQVDKELTKITQKIDMLLKFQFQ